MVIYADVLFILNTVTDYFLIKLSGVIANKTAVFWRLAFAAVLGGLSSFYILLPPLKLIVDLPIKVAISAILVLTAFGYSNRKIFLKLTFLLFALTFSLGGILTAAEFCFDPQNIYINNQIPYIDINPIVFIISGVAYYFVAVLVKRLTERNGEFSKECKIAFSLNNMTFCLTGMIDTGNSLTDVFGISEIIIVEKSIIDKINRDLSASEKAKRFRAIPIKTVSGEAVLNGIRVEKAVIEFEKNKKTLINPIIVSSKTDIKDGWDAIVNPRSIL